MRVLLTTFGSRGDVEPMAALAARLRALDVDAVVCCPPDPELGALVSRAGAILAPAFTAIRPWVAAAMANQPPMPLPERAAGVLAAQFEAISAAAEGCDAIVATGLFPSTAAARSVAEIRGLPYLYAAYCPLFLPSHHHRPFAYPGYPLPPEVTDNRALWTWDIAIKNEIFGGSYNAHRTALGLARVENVRDHVFTDRPWLAADPVLGPWRPTDLREAVQTGAWILPDERPLPPELEAFLDAGPPPVYVGFGSMPMPALKAAARSAMDAVRARGRRVLLAHGWAELALEDEADDAFAVGEVNQQRLFARVEAVVHHGGAGTTTAAARAGAPQVVVPQVADQPYWGSRVAGLGLGAVTFESLSAALDTALKPQTQQRAVAVAGSIRADGAEVAARSMIEALGW